MTSTVLAFDLGTGGIKAAVFGPDGTGIAERVVGYPTHYPGPSRHEQRPQDWWNALEAALRDLLAEPGVEPGSIAALSISGQSLGCVPVAADGMLLRDAVPIWSDGRAEAEAAAFFEQVDPAQWYLTTGNGFPPPLYTIFKIVWLRRHEPDLFARTRYFLGSKDYLNFKLTGRMATDPSYASGSGAYDLRARRYSEDLLAAAELDPHLLPPIVPSTEVVGEVLPNVAKRLGLPAGVKVVAGGVDNSCMALGAATFAEGDAYGSMGSSSWLAVASAEPLLDEAVRPFVFAHVVPEMNVSATSIFSSGTSLAWLRDRVGGAKALDYDALFKLAEISPPGARGLLFVPTLAGGTSFEGGPSVRGALVGLDLQHGDADLVRAGLEGIALGLRVALDELRRMTRVSDAMLLVGGGAKSPLWRQIYADVFGCTVEKSSIDQQAATLGAAALALVGIGLWNDFEPVRRPHVVEARTHPDPRRAGLYSKALEAYRVAARQQAENAPALAALRQASQ